MVKVNVGDIVQIIEAHSNGRSSLPYGPLLVVVTKPSDDYSERFYAKPIDKSIPQNSYWYLTSEVSPAKDRPRSTIKSRVVGVKVTQW